MNKAPAKKAPVKKQVASTQAKKSAVKQVPAKKAPAKKALVQKTPVAKKAAAKNSAVKVLPKSASVTKAPIKKAVATKTAPAKQAVPSKASATKAPAKTAAAKRAVEATPAPEVEKAPAKVIVEKKAPPAKKPSPGYRKDVAFLERQKQALLDERSSRLAQEQSQKQEAAALVEEMEPGDIQFDEESGEGGTLAVDREIHLELAAKQRLLVEEIDLALRKIALGTYGICERCESLIPKTRLTAIPEARICVPCSAGGLSRR